LEYANNGIQVLSKEINEITQKISKNIKEDEYISNNYSPVKPIDEEQTEEEKVLVSTKKEKTSLLAIAFYNAGSQLEFLKSYKESLDSFNRAIKILERNFPPNHSLTVEFKKNLSKALERYKKHLSWKGSNKTFSNLCFNSGTRRVPHSQNRPTSAATAMQKPVGARFKKISRNRRPITAKTRKCK